MAEGPPLAALAAPMPEPEGRPPESHDGEHGMSRRDFLVGLGLGGAGVVGLEIGGFDAVRAWRRHEGRNDAKALFDKGLYNWHKLSIFPSLLQIDPSVTVAPDMFAKPAAEPDWPEDEFILALRPIGVKATLLDNIADQDRATQDSVDRVLDEIPPRLLAFYQPGPGKLVYCDADANKGLIAPMSNEYSEDASLPITKVWIDGREVRGNVVYPYTLVNGVTWEPDAQQLTQLERTKGHKKQHHEAELGARADANDYSNGETYQLIGQCVTAATVGDMNYMVKNFLSGDGPNTEPLSLPRP